MVADVPPVYSDSSTVLHVACVSGEALNERRKDNARMQDIIHKTIHLLDIQLHLTVIKLAIGKHQQTQKHKFIPFRRN
jgi:hypothetical protein